MRSKWSITQAGYTNFMQCFKKFGKVEYDNLQDYLEQEQIIFYKHCMFKRSPIVKFLTREAGAG